MTTRKLVIAWVVVTVLAALAWIFGTPKAKADMCGPSSLPGLSYMYPFVKDCQPYVPGVALPGIPTPAEPDTANGQYPTYVPQAFPPAFPVVP